MGTSGEEQQLQQNLNQKDSNELSLKLHADFFAEVLADCNLEYLEEVDIQEVLNAASAVADAIQKDTPGKLCVNFNGIRSGF